LRATRNLYIHGYPSSPDYQKLLSAYKDESRAGAVAQIVLCHPELDSGSYNLLILLDAETSSACHNCLNCYLGNTPSRLDPIPHLARNGV